MTACGSASLQSAVRQVYHAVRRFLGRPQNWIRVYWRNGAGWAAAAGAPWPSAEPSMAGFYGRDYKDTERKVTSKAQREGRDLSAVDKRHQHDGASEHTGRQRDRDRKRDRERKRDKDPGRKGGKERGGDDDKVLRLKGPPPGKQQPRICWTERTTLLDASTFKSLRAAATAAYPSH